MATQYGEQPNRGRNNEQPEPQPPPRKPDAQTVADFHTFADTDTTEEAIHHTLGVSPTQAAKGDHRHDGGDSVLLLEGHVISGTKSNPITVFPSIIQALVRLGAEDATT